MMKPILLLPKYKNEINNLYLTLIASIEMVKCNNPHYHNDIIPFGSGITFDINRIFDSIHICIQQDDIVFDLDMERWYTGASINYKFLGILVSGLKLANRLTR